MIKHTFESDTVVIWENKLPPHFIPLWEKTIQADNLSDVPKDYLNSLSEEDYYMIVYFFEDKNNDS